MDVKILKRPTVRKLTVTTLRRRIERILSSAGAPGDTELSVLLVDDDEMKQLNSKHRGIDKPTDVLSFSQVEGEFGDIEPNLLGDLVVSVDTARRQARDRGLELEGELDYLFTHGILHLLGYDHERGREQAREMSALENRIVSELDGEK